MSDDVLHSFGVENTPDESLGWLNWETSLASLEKMWENIDTYNISLPYERYVLQPKGTLVKLNGISTSISLTPVNMDKLEVLPEGLQLNDANSFIVLNVKGTQPVKLGGKISFVDEPGELYIFSKHGFVINGLELTNITLHLISATLETYFLEAQKGLTKEKVKTAKYETALSTFMILESGVIGNSNLHIYASAGNCAAIVGVIGFNLYFYPDALETANKYSPFQADNCQIIGDQFLLQSPNSSTELNLNYKIIAKQVHIISGGKIGFANTFSLHGSGRVTIQAIELGEITGWLYVTEDLNLISGNDQELLIVGKLQSAGSISIQAGSVRFYDEVAECLGVMIIRASSAANCGIFLYENSGIKANAMVIKSLNGGVIGHLQLESARIEISKDATIRAELINIGISINTPKIIKTNIFHSDICRVKAFHYQLNDVDAVSKLKLCGPSIGSIGCLKYDLYLYTPNNILLQYGIYIGGNLFLDSNQLNIHLTKIIVSQNIIIIASEPVKLIITSETVYKEITVELHCPNAHILQNHCTFESLYSAAAFIHLNYGVNCKADPNRVNDAPMLTVFNKIRLITGQDLLFENWNTASSLLEIICLPASLSALEGIYGKFEKIEIGCFKDSSASYIDPIAKIQQLLGGQAVSPHSLATIAQELTVRGHRELFIHSQQYQSSMQESRPAKDLEPERFTKNFHLKPADELSQIYEYYYSQKYPALSSCGIDITKILLALNIPSQEAGKVICTADCQLEMVRKSLEQCIGFSDFSFIFPVLQSYLAQNFPDADQQEKDCIMLNLLLNNALEQYKILSAEVGVPIAKENFHFINKPFIWPVYEEHNGVKLLSPAIYFPQEVIANAPARVGVFMYGKHWEIEVKNALIGGTLFVGEGKISGQNMAVVGGVNKFSEQTLTIEVDNLAVTTITRLKQVSGSDTRTDVLPQASIKAEDGELLIYVHNDFLIRAGNFEGKITAQVDKDIIIIPALDISTHEHYHRKGYHKWVVIKNIPATFKGEITFISKGNQNIIGAQVAGESSFKTVSTAGDIQFAPARNLVHEESSSRSKKWYGSSRHTHSVNHQESLVGNVFGDQQLPMQSFSSIAYGNMAVSALELYTKEFLIKAGEGNTEPKTITISSEQIQNYHQSKVSKKQLGLSFHGGVNFATMKTVISTDSQTTQVPSKIVIFGNAEGTPAYFISNGKYIQLASHINNNGKLVISAPLGIYIADLPSTQIHIVDIEKGKSGISFKLSKEEGGIQLGVEFKSSHHHKGKEIPIPSSITTDELELHFDQGYLHTRGALLSYNQALFKGLEHIDEAAVAKFFELSKETSGSLHLKLGFRTNLGNAIAATQRAEHSNTNSSEQTINTVSNYRAAFVEWMKFIVLPVQFGLYVHGKFEKKHLVIEQVIPVASEFHGAETLHEVEKLKMQGSKVIGIKWYVSAKEVLLTTAFSSFEQKNSATSIEAIIPITGAVMPSLNLMPINKHELKVTDYHQLLIQLEGEIVFDIAGPINIEGAYINADKIIINAEQLLIKSVQKLVEEHGTSLQIGLGDITKITKIFSSVGGHVERRDSRWVDSLTELLGRSSVEIILAGALNIIGAIIANAEYDEDGTLTDKGKLHIKAAEIFAESIYSYDNGNLLGASFAKGEKNGIFGDSYGAKFGYRDLEEVIIAGIGAGEVEAEISGQYVRDITQVRHASGTCIDPIDVKWQSVDYEKLSQTLLANDYVERVYRESGAAEVTSYLKDFWNSFWQNDGRKELLPVEESLGEYEQEEDLEEPIPNEEEESEEEPEEKPKKEVKPKKKQEAKKQEAKKELPPEEDLTGKTTPWSIEDVNDELDYLGADNKIKQEALRWYQNIASLDLAQQREIINKLIIEKQSSESIFGNLFGAKKAYASDGYWSTDPQTMAPAAIPISYEAVLWLGAALSSLYFSVVKINTGNIESFPIQSFIPSIFSTPVFKESFWKIETFPVEDFTNDLEGFVTPTGDYIQQESFPVHEGDIHIVFQFEIDGKKYQEHHVISDKNSWTKDHELWELAGVGPQSRMNKIFLPTSEEHHPTRSIHLGKHFEIVNRKLSEKMDEVADLGKTSGWTTEQFKEGLHNIWRDERAKLKSGERGLNKNKRPWAEEQK